MRGTTLFLNVNNIKLMILEEQNIYISVTLLEKLSCYRRKTVVASYLNATLRV